jgi:hypothetical protein
MDDSDYLRLLTSQAEQANAFLSNARKWERERWVCERLLQGLNIAYREDEFTPAGQEPPDVLFREASFEVFFVLDEGRRLNDEWREELQRRRSAFSLSQLVRREARPKRIRAPELLQRLAPTLRKKAHNYRERGMDLGELDIIAFASLKRETLDLNSHFPPPIEFLRQGWRSMSGSVCDRTCVQPWRIDGSGDTKRYCPCRTACREPCTFATASSVYLFEAHMPSRVNADRQQPVDGHPRAPQMHVERRPSWPWQLLALTAAIAEPVEPAALRCGA